MIADPDAFVQERVTAWNSHDVERVLTHFHQDAIFASPYGQLLLEGSDGVFRGKSAIGSYWQAALGLIPDQHFTVLRKFVGVKVPVIKYRNQRGVTVDEVLIFDGLLVKQGYGTYPPNSCRSAVSGENAVSGTAIRLAPPRNDDSQD